MPIYSKNGDKGKSRTSGRKQLPKSDLVFEVLGTLDELSVSLGFLHLTKISEISKLACGVQSDLLLLGSKIAGSKIARSEVKLWKERVLGLEKSITFFDSKNSKLTKFILPGGSIEALYLHVSRVVCRRFERMFVRYVRLSKRSDLKVALPYVNRLSDLCFVLARYCNKKKGIRVA